jgi:cytochrome c553
MEKIIDTYGKTWHTWHTDQKLSLPLGHPVLMMGFTADGQVDEAMVAERHRRMGISSAEKRQDRESILAPAISPGADAWQHCLAALAATARQRCSRSTFSVASNGAAANKIGRIMITGWHVCGFGVGLMLSINCHADGAAIAKTGAEAAPACQICHGAAGEGSAPAGFPRLAGLGATYLQRQLAAFADGTRVNAVMMPIAKALSVAERVEVSAYYAALPVPVATLKSAPAPMPTPDSVGATLATRGRWADKLPACEQCHGPGGRGVGHDFPALTGQSATYLANQLAAWKTGARPPGPQGLMAAVAKKLSAAELRAVADHYAALPARAAQ